MWCPVDGRRGVPVYEPREFWLIATQLCLLAVLRAPPLLRDKVPHGRKEGNGTPSIISGHPDDGLALYMVRNTARLIEWEAEGTRRFGPNKFDLFARHTASPLPMDFES